MISPFSLCPICNSELSKYHYKYLQLRCTNHFRITVNNNQIIHYDIFTSYNNLYGDNMAHPYYEEFIPFTDLDYPNTSYHFPFFPINFDDILPLFLIINSSLINLIKDYDSLKSTIQKAKKLIPFS